MHQRYECSMEAELQGRASGLYTVLQLLATCTQGLLQRRVLYIRYEE